jgi:hypothetical protein
VTVGARPTARVQIQKLDEHGHPSGDVVAADFNPTTMQYSITNQASQGSGRSRSRAVDESTGKLTMDLVFDTTDSGDDVRNKTERIALLMKPEGARGTPILQVTWGNFAFQGALDQYRETLDFFSSDGMPLRATLSLGFTTVTEQNRTPDKVFAFSSGRTGSITGNFQATNEVYEVPRAEGSSVTSTAAALGAPGVGNLLAALNGIEDVRNGLGAPRTLLVFDAPILEGPLAFATGASAGAGIGFGASAGAGAGIGFGASTGAGIGFGASAGAGIGFGASAGAGIGFGASAGAGLSAAASAGVGASFSAGARAGASFSAGVGVTGVASFTGVSGSAASAGVAASSGAFAQLGTPRAQVHSRLDVARVHAIVPPPRPVDDPSGFGPGGRALRVGGGGTVRHVSLRDLIEFED